MSRERLLQALAGAVTSAGDTPAALSRQLHEAILRHGSETPDNLACCASLRIGEKDGVAGPMLSGCGEMLQDVAWSLEEMPLPDTIRQAHPVLTEDEWSSFTRLVTLIFTSLTTKSGKSK